MAKKPFILSDQSVNCYGFIVLTAGIALARFKKNPVMLYAHGSQTDPDNVIGNWPTIYKEEDVLLGIPEIDQENDFALKVSKKVDKGYIKAASIGIQFKSEDVKLDLVEFEGIPVITKCELTEVSLCAIPGNSNAIRLYADGELIKDTSLALSLTQSTNQKPEIEPMKKIAMFAAALGLTLTDNTSEEHVLEAVKSLANDRDSIKLKYDELVKKQGDEQAAKAVTLVKDAITAKKLTADQEEKFVKLAKLDFESTKSIIDGMSAHTPITQQLNLENGGANGQGGKTDKPDYRKLQKDNPVELARIRKDEPALYKEIWQLAFPKGTFNG